MTFCTSCGKPNADDAVKCASCGFDLKPAPKGPRFKGTMIMASAAELKPPDAVIPPERRSSASPPAPPPARPSAAPPPAAAPPMSRQQGLAFQETVMGPIVPQTAPSTSGAAATGVGAASPSSTTIGTAAGLGEIPSPFAPNDIGSPLPSEQVGFAPTEMAPASSYGFGDGGFADGSVRTPSSDDVPQLPPRFSGNRKGLVWAAIGLAGVLMLACPISAVFLGVKVYHRLTDNTGDRFQAEMLRVSTTLTLGSIKASCAVDRTGGGATQSLHPSVRASLRPQVCQVSDKAIETLGNPDRSGAELLDDTDEDERAEALGLDPGKCVKITAGNAAVIGCDVPGTGFQILKLDNLGSIS